MKKHLLITAVLLLASCRSSKEVSHRADTIYIAQHRYDSVMIDRYTTTETNGDTVLVDRLTTEYRYRLLTDTLHLYHTDTVVKIMSKEVPTERCDTLKWIALGLMVLVVGLVVAKMGKG